MSGNTRSQGPIILKHILEKVMDQTPNSELAKALHQNGYTTHRDLLNMEEEDRIALEFIDDNNSKTPLHRAYKALIRIFQAYVFQNNIATSDFINITEDQFNDFRDRYDPSIPI